MLLRPTKRAERSCVYHEPFVTVAHHRVYRWKAPSALGLLPLGLAVTLR